MTKGYKGCYDFTCLGFKYEVGQEYKMEGKLFICDRGFHYCVDPSDTLCYYPYEKRFKLLEILDLNPTETLKGAVHDIRCSNHIKIIREINDPDELLKLLGENYWERTLEQSYKSYDAIYSG
jgi:hypothetical protein